MTRTKAAPRRAQARSSATLNHIAEMLADGQVSAKERWDELKADFNAKHEENRDRRHAQGNKIEEVENRVHVLGERVGALETKLVSIIGDNSGGSGLLHDIDKKQDALQKEMGTIKSEIASIKQTVQDTPAINKWVYGAIAVLGFVAVVVPIVVVVVFEILKLVTKH